MRENISLCPWVYFYIPVEVDAAWELEFLSEVKCIPIKEVKKVVCERITRCSWAYFNMPASLRRLVFLGVRSLI